MSVAVLVRHPTPLRTLRGENQREKRDSRDDDQGRRLRKGPGRRSLDTQRPRSYLSAMKASLVISSHNEGDCLWKTVRSCKHTAGALDCEIIVADDASTDGSIGKLKRRYPDVRVVASSERRGVSPTKDLGA